MADKIYSFIFEKLSKIHFNDLTRTHTNNFSKNFKAMKHLKYLFFLPASLVLILLSCGKTSNNDYTDGNWVYNTNSIPGANRSGAVCFVVGKLAYIGTGYNVDLVQNRLSDFYSYDPNNGEKGDWQQIATFPGTPRSQASAFAIGNYGYVTLGQDIQPVSLIDTWQYDTQHNTWTKKADFGSGDSRATARRDATGFAIGNYGYIVCGYDTTGSNKKDSWVYDPTIDKWSLTTQQFPGGKRQGAIALVHGDSAYIVTGIDGTQALDMIKFTPKNTTKQWWTMQEITNVSTDPFDDDYTDIVRDHGVGFTLGDSAYITQGNGSGGVKTWGYDFKSDRWFRRTSFEIRGAQSTRTYGLGFTVQGRAFVCTGLSGGAGLGDLIEWLPYVTYNSND